MAERLVRLKTLLPAEAAGEDVLLTELLSAAESFILNYTGRDALPERLYSAQLRLAVQAYNRLGTEGERGRREGGLAMQFEELPQGIRAQLKAWRLAKAGSL